MRTLNDYSLYRIHKTNLYMKFLCKSINTHKQMDRPITLKVLYISFKVSKINI